MRPFGSVEAPSRSIESRKLTTCGRIISEARRMPPMEAGDTVASAPAVRMRSPIPGSA